MKHNLFLILIIGYVIAQDEVVVLSHKVGTEIDVHENLFYRIFPKENKFVNAQLIQLSKNKFEIRIIHLTKDGNKKEKTRYINLKEFASLQNHVNGQPIFTEKEKVAAAKIPKYAELIEQVEEANQEKDYAKTIRLLDEDIARRTPDEQQRVLKISGLMSVLVASKKLKTAISTIDDYDLPEDQALEQLSSSLEEWIQQNLIVE